MPGDDMAEFCGRFETNPQWSRPICINCGRHFTDHPAELLRASPPKPRLYTRAEVERIAEAVRAETRARCEAVDDPDTGPYVRVGVIDLAAIIDRATGGGHVE